MISLYPLDRACAACGTTVRVGEDHRSRLPSSDLSAGGVDGRPGLDAEWLPHAFFVEECARCGHLAPNLSLPYPSLAPAHEARRTLLALDGHAPAARRFLAVASLFSGEDPREEGSWVLRAAWQNEASGAAEIARPLRLRAAAQLEDALTEGFALVPVRGVTSLRLAECFRIGGDWDRAFSHCVRGLRFAKTMPSDTRKLLLFEAACVLERRREPLTREAALAGFEGIGEAARREVLEQARSTIARLEPMMLRPRRTFDRAAMFGLPDEAAIFACDFMDEDLMLALLRDRRLGVWEAVCTRPALLPALLRATDHGDSVVRQQALAALYDKSLRFDADVLDGQADAVLALVRRLADPEPEPVRYAGAVLKQLLAIDASGAAAVVAAARAALSRWTTDLSTEGVLERLIELAEKRAKTGDGSDGAFSAAPKTVVVAGGADPWTPRA